MEKTAELESNDVESVFLLSNEKAMKNDSQQNVLPIRLALYLVCALAAIAIFILVLNFVVFKLKRKLEGNNRKPFFLCRDKSIEARKLKQKSNEIIANAEFEFVLTEHSSNSLSSKRSRARQNDSIYLDDNRFRNVQRNPITDPIQRSITEQYIHELNEKEKLNGTIPIPLHQSSVCNSSTDLYENMTNFFDNLKESQA
jgi:hypothetical protein